MLGFDAFVDTVARRSAGLGEGPIETMDELGRRLLLRHERSGTVFLKDVTVRSGGNTPNTAETLASLGASVTCLGAFGRPRVNDVFAPLGEKCRLISIADPAACLALEFGEAKLFFGSNGELDELTWDRVVSRVGAEALCDLYAGADVIGLFNWAEIRPTQALWEGLLRDVLPVLPRRERTFFIDFSDLTARSDKDILRALETLGRFRDYGQVVISANAPETERLMVLNARQLGACDLFILHSAARAAVYMADDTIELPTRRCERPARLTGGGDCFNGGYIFARMAGLDPADSLRCAMAAAGCLVRTGRPPDRESLIDELEKSGALWG